jgi:hypothetical protein
MSAKASSQGHSVAEWLTARPLLIFIVFAIEILTIDFLKLPEIMTFDSYAFCDSGANLTLQYLVSHGLRPTIDFGYNYGLLPILIGRIWFAIAGLAPISLQVLMAVCDLVIAWAMVKICSRIRLGAVGLALIAITLGFAVQASYPSLAQAVEAVLLVSALAYQAGGSRAGALAFACAAVFAKPSMGYVYSLLLLVAIVCQRWRTGAKLDHWIRELAPAVVTGSALILVLGIIYGPVALVRTVIPIEGISNYRAVNFGFFTGTGREFWDLRGLPWFAYLIEIPGFWIAGTLFLICSGVAAIFYLATHADDAGLESRRNEIIAICAVLHIAFIALFFGNQWSWIYYAYFLTVGVAAAAGSSAIQRSATIGLCVMGIMVWQNVAFWELRWWQTRERDSVTSGLWASADERTEWRRVLDSIHGSKAVVLDLKGAVELMYPEFELPITLYMDPGLIKPFEIRRKVEQMSEAQMVVVPANIGIESCKGIPAAPEFETALKNFEPRMMGKFFDVYQRPKE